MKITALVGAVVYCALFTGYRAFYEALGIRPEEVGISHIFILVRSAGFLIVTVPVALGWIYFSRVIREKRPASGSARLWASLVLNVGAGLCFGIAVTFMASRAWSVGETILFWVLVLGVSFILGLLGWKMSGDEAAVLGGLAVVIAALLLTSSGLCYIAMDRADKVKSGEDIKPFTLFNIPILDVSSDKVNASWICPEAQKPPPFNDTKGPPTNGILIGESDTTYIIRLSQSEHQIVSVPKTCAMLSRIDEAPIAVPPVDDCD